MPVFRPRNRLVNFRLSEDEFEKVRASCALYGARSLSDFARSAVLRSVTNGPVPSESHPDLASEFAHGMSFAGTSPAGMSGDGRAHYDSKVNQLDRKVGELETRITELLSLMQHVSRLSPATQAEAPAIHTHPVSSGPVLPE